MLSSSAWAPQAREPCALHMLQGPLLYATGVTEMTIEMTASGQCTYCWQ